MTRIQRTCCLITLCCVLITTASNCPAQVLAGVAKVDVTDYEGGPVNDPLYVKALVLQREALRAVIITVDAVAIGEIGRIDNDFLPTVRAKIEQAVNIPGENVLVNASHCHGVVRRDIDVLTIEAVQEAAKNMVPVHVGAGSGYENRVGENRRLIMKDGREIDVRHAYSMPPDAEVATVGPIDPEIGILRLDRVTGEKQPLAILYNYACHPIQGVPSGANTADMTGFASKAIEENLGEDTIALFIQGCGGDINPIFYKDVAQPRDAEPLGNRLGLSALRAIRKIETKPADAFVWTHQTIELPRADLANKIVDLKDRRDQLARELKGTTLSLKTFLPLMVKYRVADDFPSYYAQGYLQEESLKRKDLATMDARNRRDIAKYIRNVEKMEQLTRMNTNLALLRKHQSQNMEAAKRTVEVELIGMRLGDFVLTTFPGELTVQIGLNLKDRSPHDLTFVAGYTNGYIYYAPTSEQLANVGGAQEDSDCILAPHWQAIYEKRALRILQDLADSATSSGSR
ncbi:MAG: hypothetical protein AB8B91_02245 [Rubripirellula sp.]